MARFCGAYLKKAREDAGMTQPELAIRAGITPKTLSAYETGAAKCPPWDVGMQLAMALDKNSGYFFIADE